MSCERLRLNGLLRRNSAQAGVPVPLGFAMSRERLRLNGFAA